MDHLAECQKNGRETHNRFWISAALADQGCQVSPEDWRIAAAVERYFSAFLDYCRLIPGTGSMLETVKTKYRLGLLTNFTHGPAARNILDYLASLPFSASSSSRENSDTANPIHRYFLKLVEHFGVEPDQILYVGDDPEPDIEGARAVGLQPVWTTYVMDHQVPYARAF